MNGNPRCMGKKLFLAIPSFQKRKSQNSGNHDQERGRSGGRRERSVQALQMSDLALSWGAQSELGGWSRGLRLALPDSSKQGHQSGTPSSLVPAVGVGRQVDKGHPQGGGGGGAPPSEQARFSSLS